MFRLRPGGIEVLLVHPGGPFWAKKDLGAWSIPKGEYAPEEDPLDAARREFTEEIGVPPQGEFIALQPVKQSGGKVVTAWAFEGDCDPAGVKSNSFAMEWPPRSGRMQEFPEIDRAAWFAVEEAKQKINKGQRALLEQLLGIVRGRCSSEP